MSTPQFEHLQIVMHDKVAQIQLNRPDKANSLTETLWDEIGAVFRWVGDEPSVRAVVLTGSGKHFCAGIDLALFGSVGKREGDLAKNAYTLRKFILRLQDAFTEIERCNKPVISAIQGVCFGGGVDLACATDIRFCTNDARFSILEIELGMAADVGTLQRLPYIVNPGIVAELAYTGREFNGEEAKQIGFVTRTFPSYVELLEGALQMAQVIASKAPSGIRSIKRNLLYTRDHTVEDSLEYIATWNASQLMSNDLPIAVMARSMKQPPQFEDS